MSTAPGLLDEGGDLLVVRHVEGAVSMPLGVGVPAVRIDVGRDDLRPFAREGEGGGAPIPGRRRVISALFPCSRWPWC
jgi:hypothetical protein